MLVCSVHFHLHFYLLVKKLHQIALNMRLHPFLSYRTGLNFLNMWHWIMWYIRENYYARFHIKYLRKNMDMIHWFTYLHFQHESSWQILLVIPKIVLQSLVSGFLIKIFCFVIPLTCDDPDYCCTHCDGTKTVNSYKGLLKAIRFLTTDKKKCYVKK